MQLLAPGRRSCGERRSGVEAGGHPRPGDRQVRNGVDASRLEMVTCGFIRVNPEGMNSGRTLGIVSVEFVLQQWSESFQK